MGIAGSGVLHAAAVLALWNAPLGPGTDEAAAGKADDIELVLLPERLPEPVQDVRREELALPEPALPDPVPETPPLPEPEPEEMAEEPLILGIDESTHQTKNWLGFADPSPHQALRGEVEQPALELNPGGREASEPEPPESPAPPAVAAEAQPPQPQSAVPDTATEAVTEQPQSARPTLPAPSTVVNGSPLPAPGELPIAPAEVESAPVPLPAPVQPPTAQTPATATAEATSEPVPPAAQPAPNQPQPVAPGDGQGIASDKQSDAASKEDPVEVRPGRPAAAEGLDIVTRRPEFTALTRLTAVPSSPVVRVKFDRAGRVSEATIVKSSGYVSVDEPVLNAIYQWRARGKRLATLSPTDPKAGVSVTFTVILN